MSVWFQRLMLMLFGTLLVAPAAFADDAMGYPGVSGMNPEMMQQMRQQVMPGMRSDLRTVPRRHGEREPEVLAPWEGMSRGKGGMQGVRATRRQMIAHDFYLDQVDVLDLSDDQVAKLKSLRNECRSGNIRAAAEIKILRLELDEILNGNWLYVDVEKSLRKQQEIEMEMQLRHFKALSEARSLLSDEQRRKATAHKVDLLAPLFR
ncbi:MAG: hypothetical protein C0621_00805 [Desulfuromonas sp.]|nr:MAG: hypothetical protein C0621_00805 [Desulfuromonas sp.]